MGLFGIISDNKLQFCVEKSYLNTGKTSGYEKPEQQSLWKRIDPKKQGDKISAKII